MLEQFPQALKESRRWVCFDASKRPIDPATGQNAKPNDPATWGTLDTAQAAVTRFGLRGVGVLLGEGLCGIDIDHCRDPGTGALSAMAEAIIGRMQTYTEASPSGTGVHLLFYGQKPAGACRKSSIGLEMYDGGRYFTVTGNALNACAIEERTAECAAVHEQYLAKPEPPALPSAPQVWQKTDKPDEELLRTACAAKDGERFAALYAGNWQPYYNSHSEADLSFCNLLAFWFGADPEKMDHIFRTSGLMRPKWDQRRGAKTYGRWTLERAVSDCQEVYSPPAQDAEAFADQEQALAALNAKYAPGTPAQPAPGVKSYSLDDTGNARRFRDRYADRVRYNPTDKCWMVWDGARWKRDDLAAVKGFADEMLDQMDKACFGIRDTESAGAMRRHVQKSRSSRGKEAFLKEAQHLPGIPMLPDQFDRNRGLLNVRNGILDLAKREILPHDREKYITRMAQVDYDPQAKAPVWEAFIQSITGGDTALAEYLQVMVGYCLCGSTREQCMFFLYGEGANGKSTFLETLAKMLGDYCMNAQADTIASTRSRSSGAARSDVARLKGARFVTLEEGDQGALLDEGLVKQMTGGNTITARFQYGKEFEFRPEFKLLEATNHLPRIHGTDVGIWRRIRLVPFTQRIPEEKQDMLLPQKLEAELPGILNWALDGLSQWLRNSQGGKRHGLPACPAVDSAVNAYRQDQDRIAAFLADCTVPAEGEAVQASVLFRTYLNWCSENNEKWRMANKQFGMEVKKHYEVHKGMYYFEYVDIALSDEGLRCMALGRSAEPSSPPARSRPLYEQTRLKN
nr:MAG TPA: dsDNA helicase [Caudoviricetes sp.]